MVAIFTMGIVFPFANQKGAVSGAIIGCLCGWIVYAGAKTWPKSEFLTNRIPTEANFDQCPSGWVDDMNLFLTGSQDGSNFNCSSIENRGPRPDFDDYDAPLLELAEMDSYHCFPEISYHDYYLAKISALAESSHIDSLLKFYQYLSHMSYLYLSFFCFVVSMVVGLTVSILTGNYQTTNNITDMNKKVDSLRNTEDRIRQSCSIHSLRQVGTNRAV